MLTAALDAEVAEATAVAQTLTSASLGLIHQVANRDEYLERLRVAVRLLIG